MDILRPQRKTKTKHPRHIARLNKIEEPNQLWEMDVKYCYITGTDSFLFQLSLIDVFDRSIIDYHLGLTCKAKDAVRILKSSLAKRGLGKGMSLPKIRTDNGPQFTSNLFARR
jgi:putative transposase